MTALYYLTITLFILLSAFICLIVLIQENKSSGLGAAFGGADAGSSLLGTSTNDFLKKTTTYMAIAFVSLCILLSFWTASLGSKKSPARDLGIEEVQTKSSQ